MNTETNNYSPMVLAHHMANHSSNQEQTPASQYCYVTTCITDTDEDCFVIHDRPSADKKQLTELTDLIARVRNNMKKAAIELHQNNGEIEVII